MFNNRLIWITPALICSATLCVASAYLTVSQAQKLCFPSATQFIETTYHLSPDQLAKIEKNSGISARFPDQKVWAAYAGKQFLGWFILDEVMGKHEAITWALAIGKDGKVLQLEILEYRENYGSEVRQKKWQSQFIGKSQGAPLKLNQDILNISGSTLSSRHVTDGVKRLLSFYEIVLKSH